MPEETSRYTNSIFEESWWLDIVADDCWKEAIVRDGEDNIIARLPYCFINGIIQNPVYTQTLGIWMDHSVKEYEKGNSQLYKQKEIINELINQLPKSKKISLTLDNELTYVLPFRWLGYHIDPTFSYRIKNVKNVNIQNDIYGKTVKKNIKAAQKKVHIIENSKDYNTLIRLQNMTYEKQGRKNPIDQQITYNVMKASCERGHGRLMIAEDEEGNPHSAGFFIFDDRTCYYLLGGYDSKYNSDGSQNLLLDAAIKFAQTVSMNFDFEGSMIEGIENFYRQFGGNQVINYHVSKQNILFDAMDLLKPRIKKLIGYKN